MELGLVIRNSDGKCLGAEKKWVNSSEAWVYGSYVVYEDIETSGGEVCLYMDGELYKLTHLCRDVELSIGRGTNE